MRPVLDDSEPGTPNWVQKTRNLTQPCRAVDTFVAHCHQTRRPRTEGKAPNEPNGAKRAKRAKNLASGAAFAEFVPLSGTLQSNLNDRTLYDGTPLGWAKYGERQQKDESRARQYQAIAAYLLAKGGQ